MITTPQAADMFARFMSRLFDDRSQMPAPGAFCTFFGRPETGADVTFADSSEVVDIDIIKGNEKIAAMVPRGISGRFLSGQKNTQEQESSSFSRAFPLIEEEGDITAAQLNKALAGEARYNSGENQFTRLRMLAFKIHSEHMRRIARTYEFLASQSVILGQQPAILGTTNSDLIYDFRRSAGNLITVGTAWSNVASDILGDVDAGCFRVRQQGRMNPDMMLLSGVDMDSFLKNTAIKEQADNRRFELIEVSRDNPVPDRFARFVANGLIPRGRLRTPKGFELWMFTYIDSFESDAGTPTLYLPDNKTVICSSMARCDAHFGPGEVIPAGSTQKAWMREMFGFDLSQPQVPENLRGTKFEDILVASVHADAYPGPGGKTVTVRAQAAPIFPTTQTDAFVTLTTVP